MLKDLVILGVCLGGAYMLFGRKKEAAQTNDSNLIQDGSLDAETATQRLNNSLSFESQTSGICRDSQNGSTYFSNDIRGTKNGCRAGDSLVY